MACAPQGEGVVLRALSILINSTVAIEVRAEDDTRKPQAAYHR